MSRASLWDVLQIEATDDPSAIRRAYARRLKVTHPEDDPKGFQALREAYDHALWYVEQRRREALYEAMETAEADIDEEGAFDPHADEATFHSGHIDRTSPLVVPRSEPAPVRSPAPAPAEPALAFASLEEELLARELERDGQALRDGAEELERLLQAHPFDERAAVRQLTQLLEMPALQNIGLSSGFEAWVENTLLSNLPNADVLIPLAVARFHWRRNAEGLRRQVGDGAVAREEDLIKFRDLQRKGGRYNDAVKALMAKPTRWRTLRWLTTPGLAKEVANVLKAFREERPGLMQNLDAEAVAWWDAAPDKPKAGVGTFLLSATPFVGLWVGVAHHDGPISPPTACLLFLGALACSAAIAAGTFYGVICPRARWRQVWSETAPDWVRWGWAPFALVPPLTAGLLTSLGVHGVWAVLPVAILGLAAVVWARITGEPDTSPIPARAMGLAHDAAVQPIGRLVLRSVYLAVFWAFLPSAIPLAQWLPLTIGLIACLLAVTDGLGGLKDRLARIPPAKRQRLYAPAALVVVCAMVLVATFGSGEAAGPWLALLIGLLAIAEPLADTPLTEEAMRQRAGIMIPLLGVLWMFLPMLTLWQDGALRVNGVWLLCGWLIALWYGRRRDRKLALPDRPRIRFGNIP